MCILSKVLQQQCSAGIFVERVSATIHVFYPKDYNVPSRLSPRLSTCVLDRVPNIACILRVSSNHFLVVVVVVVVVAAAVSVAVAVAIVVVVAAAAVVVVVVVVVVTLRHKGGKKNSISTLSSTHKYT